MHIKSDRAGGGLRQLFDHILLLLHYVAPEQGQDDGERRSGEQNRRDDRRPDNAPVKAGGKARSGFVRVGRAPEVFLQLRLA